MTDTSANPEADRNEIELLQKLLDDLDLINHRQATRQRILEALSQGLRIPMDALQEDDRTQAIWLVRSHAAEIDRTPDGQSVIVLRKSAFRAVERFLSGSGRAA